MKATVLAEGCKFVRMEDAGRFNLPSQAIVVHAGLVNELHPGDYVKVALRIPQGVCEKFWCEFKSYDPETELMTLKVSNDLVYTAIHALDDGDEILVDKKYLCAAILE